MPRDAPISSPVSGKMPRRAAGASIAVLLALTVAVVAIPVFTILPFKAQTSRGVAISYELSRWGPILTLLATIAVLALAIWLWRGARRWTRVALVLALLPLGGALFATRINRFEKMFAPIHGARFAAAPAASWVEPADMVLAIKVGDEAVAYPERQVSYHHVVQDVVGGVPIVATY